jgi:hypothetical protein
MKQCAICKYVYFDLESSWEVEQAKEKGIDIAAYKKIPAYNREPFLTSYQDILFDNNRSYFNEEGRRPKTIFACPKCGYIFIEI